MVWDKNGFVTLYIIIGVELNELKLKLLFIICQNHDYKIDVTGVYLTGL